jgi:hypothetical protein
MGHTQQHRRLLQAVIEQQRLHLVLDASMMCLTFSGSFFAGFHHLLC